MTIIVHPQVEFHLERAILHEKEGVELVKEATYQRKIGNEAAAKLCLHTAGACFMQSEHHLNEALAHERFSRY